MDTTRDIVRRAKVLASRYKQLLVKYNAILCWYEISPLDENGEVLVMCEQQEQ